jgi:hypothetical protein
MLSARIRIVTVALVALVALSSTAVASAASHGPSGKSHRPVHARSVSRTVERGPGPIVKSVPKGAVMAISAFPAGGKGGGTEATCALWSGQLNEEQGEIEAAEDNNDVQQYKEAKGAQEADIDNALDAGCAVIY